MKSVKDYFMYALGGLITIGFFILLYFLIFEEISENNKEILNLTIGALIGAFSMVVSYFYGSSKGSSDKNEVLLNGNGNKPTTP